MSGTHKRQPSFWLDIRHNENGSMSWGIESNDKALTFDGHYVCTFGTETTDERREAAEYVLSVLQTYAPPRKEPSR